MFMYNHFEIISNVGKHCLNIKYISNKKKKTSRDERRVNIIL